MDADTFFKMLDNTPDLPTLPNIVIEVNKMLQDSETTIKKLSHTIEKDQAMVSKILRLVNSSFYGFRSKISTIPHAIIVLGFNPTRNAVVSVSMIKTFSGKKSIEGFTIADFWKHSIEVAVTSRYLSEETGLDSPDACFVAGLLHDIGKVVLSQFFAELFSQVWKSITENGLSFYESEKKLLPVNHAQIGGYLAKKWQLPDSLSDSITYHHAISTGVANINQLMITHAANSIFDSKINPDFSQCDPEAVKLVTRKLKTISDWFPDVTKEIESACEFFLK